MSQPRGVAIYRGFSGYWLFACLFGYFGFFAFCIAVATHARLLPVVGALGGGLTLASFQWLVLRKYRVPIPWSVWALLTMFGCLVALDMIAFLALVLWPLLDRELANRFDMEIVISIGTLIWGCISAAQWTILRRYVRQAWHWVFVHVIMGTVAAMPTVPYVYSVGDSNTDFQGLAFVFGIAFTLLGALPTGAVLGGLLSRSSIAPPTPVFRFNLSSFLTLLAGMVLLIGLPAGLPTMHFPHKDQFPLYPGARGFGPLLLTDEDRHPLSFDQHKFGFETLSTPGAVAAFYETALTEDGWRPPSGRVQVIPPDLPDALTPQTLQFFESGCPYYSLDVDITPANDGITLVVLDEYAGYCY